MALRSRPLTRRGFIRGLASLGGAGAAYSALAAFDLMGRGALAAGNTTAPLPSGSLQGKSVIVIGAGIAGLCSAMRLARAGGEVTILEATDRPGGRSLTLRNGDSFREWDWNSDTTMVFEQVGDVPPDDPDNYLNAGPGRIPQHHTRVLDYCRELGVALQPYLYMDKANLMQNDHWNGGRPVQVRRLKNDLRGALAEMLAKVADQGALDMPLSAGDTEAFLQMLTHFGQLTYDGAQLVYAGAELKSDYVRAGYSVDPGDVRTPGRPWPTLSLDEVMASDFWNSEMFNDLEYFWQTSLMQPVDGMDMIWKGFLEAEVAEGQTVGDLIVLEQPVQAIDLNDSGATVRTGDGMSHSADFVVATLSAPLLARLGGNFMDGVTRQILSEVYITPACKVGFQGRSRFWEEEDRIYGGISWTKGPISQIWYPNYSFNSPTGVLTGAYNRGEDAAEFQALTRDERIEAALAGGEKLHPGYRDKVFAGNGVSIAWAKIPYQAGGWANETAFSQPDVFARMAAADAIGNRVFMAGDWFSYWPGWQVGALDSAHLATDQIARRAVSGG
ncbi:FAD-dependent oxidoreductase [Pseudoruegeria sp. HB172150]|uniref:flavin monoamine oxidase family protein n=1 Tax=Pseudoruegeria sp. HB172150 TaxID=2721164 RepID=UPI0015546CAF|nr:FAD-dependent oxidoreductase [Pseudoruegeria sp. HB172150]